MIPCGNCGKEVVVKTKKDYNHRLKRSKRGKLFCSTSCASKEPELFDPITNEILRRCTGCYKTLPLSSYATSKNCKYGKDPRCRACRHIQYRRRYESNIEYYRAKGREKQALWSSTHPLHRRNYYALKRYGTSGEELFKITTALAEKQQSRCIVCNKQGDVVGLLKQKGKRRLVLDHDHNTGQIRELLCDLCNTALGILDDDPVIVKKLLDYISRWKSWP